MSHRISILAGLLCFLVMLSAGCRSEAPERVAEPTDRLEVGCIPFIKGAASSDQREKGFVDEIKKHPNITLVPILYSSSDVEKGQQAVENMLAANPNIKGIFAANEPAGVAAARVLEERGLAGKVKLVAFDASDAEIAALERGSIQALVAQNPFRMGYDGVTAAVKTLEGESVEKRIDTGVTIITQENLDTPEVQAVLYSAQKEAETPASEAAAPPTEPKYTIALIPKGTAHTFWESVRAGGEKAGEELGAEILWNGPAVETDIEGQKRIIENFITSEVDALVLAACDAGALNSTLQEAKNKGIPIVTIDSGINDDELPVTFVATDNVAGAAVAARYLAELVGDGGGK